MSTFPNPRSTTPLGVALAEVADAVLVTADLEGLRERARSAGVRQRLELTPRFLGAVDAFEAAGDLTAADAAEWRDRWAAALASGPSPLPAHRDEPIRLDVEVAGTSLRLVGLNRPEGVAEHLGGDRGPARAPTAAQPGRAVERFAALRSGRGLPCVWLGRQAVIDAVRSPVASCCAVLVLLGALLAGCGDDDEPTAGASPAPVTQAAPAASSGDGEVATARAPVSRRRASAIARKRVGGGRVEEAERDDEDGRQVWKVKLARAGGVEHEVAVAVSTGDVLEVETDRDTDSDSDDRDSDRDTDSDDGDG